MAVSAPVVDARFVFADDLPLVVQGELYKHLPALSWALPAWIQRVTLFWSLADDGEVASIEVSCKRPSAKADGFRVVADVPRLPCVAGLRQPCHEPQDSWQR